MSNSFFNLPAVKILSLSVLLLLGACSGSGVDVTAKFSNTQDIKEQAVVYFEDQPIGEVSDVKKSQNGSIVKLSLDKDAAKNISSRAAVVVNRLKEGAPIEIYNSGDANSAPLTTGQELKGLDSMFQLGAWMVGDAIQLGSGTVSQYVDAFQEYLKGDKFQSDKAQVQTQIAQATDAAKQAMETVERDVTEAVEEATGEMSKAVADLGDELEPIVKEFAVAEQEMARTVEELGSELSPIIEELLGVESQMSQAVEELGTELAPMVKELSKSGSLLVEQLEQFTKGLENTQRGEQQAGKDFMESLLATLEKLNKSMQEGAASTDNNAAESTEK